jgi:hypothetical protein
MKVKLGQYPKKGNRKVNVQIEHFDTYSLDHSLAYIILPALIQLKQSKMGVPSEFADVGGADYDSQDSFDFYKETHDACFDIACKKWDEILDKMIWSFQQILCDEWENKYHHGKAKFDWEPDQDYTDPVTGKTEKMFRMVDKNPKDHWLDINGMRLHEERIQEGLSLFGKYYKHLWD